MSTEPYSEVGDDESGIVPTQSGRSPDWPKKIRTLTAAELDRLTIDGAGRFYWDGRLVNYEPPPSKSGDETHHESTGDSEMHAAERPTYDPNDRHPPDIDGADLPRRYEAHARHDEDGAVDLDSVAARTSTAVASAPMTQQHSSEEPVMMAPAIHIPDRVRIKFSRWQSLGAILLVLAIMAGASGMAAYGWVAAHNWGCRAGLIETYCLPEPASQPPARPDIPA
jgi:hypothetical protein